MFCQSYENNSVSESSSCATNRNHKMKSIVCFSMREMDVVNVKLLQMYRVVVMI